jgi:GH35 family endo-1,4-beta-xylanase
MVERLLDRGASIDGIGGHCGTALGAAVDSHKLEVVKYLLSRGADSLCLHANIQIYLPRQKK